MRRRELIIAIGAGAVWPIAALGQQVASRIVGVLGPGSLESSRTLFAPAQRRLAEIGYVEGRNLVVEYRGADNQEDRLDALAGDLVPRRVDAIVVFGGPPILRDGRHIPTAYPIRDFAAAGGLVSYGTNPEAYGQVGDYLGRVLNGEKPVSPSHKRDSRTARNRAPARGHEPTAGGRE